MNIHTDIIDEDGESRYKSKADRRIAHIVYIYKNHLCYSIVWIYTILFIYINVMKIFFYHENAAMYLYKT